MASPVAIFCRVEARTSEHGRSYLPGARKCVWGPEDVLDNVNPENRNCPGAERVGSVAEAGTEWSNARIRGFFVPSPRLTGQLVTPLVAFPRCLVVEVFDRPFQSSENEGFCVLVCAGI